MNIPRNEMVIVSIDFSLFTENNAFGTISGSISVPFAPEIGDIISFPLLSERVEDLDTSLYVDYVCQHFVVENRVIFANNEHQPILLSLQDLIVPTPDHAKSVMKYFEVVHGLFGDPYDL